MTQVIDLSTLTAFVGVALLHILLHFLHGHDIGW